MNRPDMQRQVQKVVPTPILRRSLRRIRRPITNIPWLYLPLAEIFSTGAPVRRNSEIVIEGFPRSANSFAEAAFRLAQKRPVRIGHHCHAAAQVMAASRWGIPCLVIIREPAEACRSLMMHHADVFSAVDLLREYATFHLGIEPFRKSFVLARFSSVTENYLEVMRAVNSRFGTDFILPDNENSTVALEEVDRLSQMRGTANGQGEPYSPKRSAIEQAAREIEKKDTRRLIDAARDTAEFALATRVFQRLEIGADL